MTTDSSNVNFFSMRVAIGDAFQTQTTQHQKINTKFQTTNTKYMIFSPLTVLFFSQFSTIWHKDMRSIPIDYQIYFKIQFASCA